VIFARAVPKTDNRCELSADRGLSTLSRINIFIEGESMAEEDLNEAEGGANADGEEGVDGEETSGKKAGLNKKLFLIIIPILLLAIGGGLYFTGVIGGGTVETEEVAGEEVEDEDADDGGVNPNAAFYALPDLIVTLSSNSGSRFLKLKVQLELENEEDLAAIESVTPRVIDQFQTYLREMRVEDLRGSAGIYRLRQELLYRVNIAAHPVKVEDVLFQEMLIQ
jgi:flagellar FliL protein